MKLLFSKYKKWFLCLGSILVYTGLIFLFVIWLLSGSWHVDEAPADQRLNFFEREPTTSNRGGENFTSPLLDCIDQSSALTNREVKTLDRDLETLIEKEKDDGHIESASIYFRSLNDGPWLGIKEKEKFLPGSLLKVPLLISALKLSEQSPTILSKKIFYAGPTLHIFSFFKPAQELVPQTWYSIKELLEHMILYSDNEAANLVIQNIPSPALLVSYSDLGMSAPDSGGVSVKTYASFFRILYNASYLNEANSEYALSLLSKVSFRDGIVSGVPVNTIVSHKFGEKGLQESSVVQLHDCGIVYYPKDPYILCIMTRGYDFGVLSSVIRSVSTKVYSIVDDDNKTR